MLRYHQFDDIGRVPRYEMRHGRRLVSGGVLAGALHTLGYYSTDVCLGSPAKRYDLIIDTGSSITAVPCSTCRQCGNHHCGITGRFDLSRSLTGKPVACRENPALQCESCASNMCTYSVHYTEGSAIKGHVISDVTRFLRTGTSPEEEDVPMDVRVFFGCQTLETGMFFKQVRNTRLPGLAHGTPTPYLTLPFRACHPGSTP